jgi:hypothetical protein
LSRLSRPSARHRFRFGAEVERISQGLTQLTGRSRASGETNLEDEAYLRHLVDELLKEPTSASRSDKATSAPTSG